MPRAKTFNDLEEVKSFFPTTSHKVVTRLLKRAQDKEAKAAQRGVAKAMSGSRAGSAVGKALGKQLAKAMSHRGGGKAQKASARQSAPDTGGRSFHFAHSVITKGDAPDGGGARKAAKSKAAAHVLYIERATAVEKIYGLSAEAEAERAQAGRDKDPDGRERDPYGIEAALSGASAGQKYIENPAKLRNGEHIELSFGNIGDTIAERIAFWESLEENERNENGRVQSRLVIELPHQADATARLDIMKGFATEFERRGLPFWVAMHAPGDKNDSRNYHAHITYSDRPAKKMLDDETGRTEWDFAIRRSYKTSSRNTKWHNPFRQKRDPDFERIDAIPKLRKKFEEAANAVFERDDVRDAHGKPVRYDARSYEDMGLDVAPMKSINRIVADKLNKGKLTVLDGDYTRKMIEAELREAHLRREPKIMELFRIEADLARMEAQPARAAAHGRALPKDMRVAPDAVMTGRAVKTLSKGILEARREALRLDVAERATTETLRGIIDATDPKAAEASLKNTRDPLRKAALADPEAVRLLNEAARELLRETEQEAAKAKRTLRYRLGNAVTAWKAVASPEPAGPTLGQRIAMEAAHAPARTASSQAPTRAAVRADAAPAPSRERPAGHQARDAAGRSDGPERAPAAERPAPRAPTVAEPTRAGTAPPGASQRVAGGRSPGEPSASPPAAGRVGSEGAASLPGTARRPPPATTAGPRAQEAELGGTARRRTPTPTLAVAMPAMPRPALDPRAVAASQAASGFFRTIMENFDNVEDRIRAVKSMTAVGRRMLAAEAAGQPREERDMLTPEERSAASRPTPGTPRNEAEASGRSAGTPGAATPIGPDPRTGPAPTTDTETGARPAATPATAPPGTARGEAATGPTGQGSIREPATAAAAPDAGTPPLPSAAPPADGAEKQDAKDGRGKKRKKNVRRAVMSRRGNGR